MMIGRGGGTFEKISVLSTLAEILIFSAIYGLAGLGQICIILLVALLIGSASGAVFLVVAVLLQFQPQLIFAVNPLRFGLMFAKVERAEHVKVAQILLAIFGLGILVVAVVGYFPAVWEWRVTWGDKRYIILSRWFGGEWYTASQLEIFARALGMFLIPSIGWPVLTLIGWAARMEVTRPKFREAPVSPTSPDGIPGPFGEVYAAKPERQTTAVVAKAPEPYVPMVEE